MSSVKGNRGSPGENGREREYYSRTQPLCVTEEKDLEKMILLSSNNQEIRHFILFCFVDLDFCKMKHFPFPEAGKNKHFTTFT